jgi:hypothetical protein
MNKFFRYSLMSAALFSVMLNAQEQRWFEVEMIIFSQTPQSALQEQFGDTVTPIKPGRAYDFITPRYQPELSNLLTALPLCQLRPVMLAEYQFITLMPRQLCIFEQQPLSWQHSSLFEPVHARQTVPYPAQLPSLMVGNGKHQTVPYLAEQDALQLTDIANKIKRQAGTSVLLHTSWRQAPVTERRAIASRWYAGKNFSAQFDYWGQPVATKHVDNNAALNAPMLATHNGAAARSETEIIRNIDMLLQQLNANGQLPAEANMPLSSVNTNDQMVLRNLPDQVWQLDGLFKLHLDHYLFVNTEFNLRVPANNALQTIYVRQSRRVISGEIHYLDHPYLGIVLQIRRYDMPEVNATFANNATQLITQ